MRKLSGIVVLLLLVAILTATTGCGSTKISDIKANPGQYEGKEISVSGTVTETFWIGLLGTGAYQVDDGTGTIWVVTKQTSPDKGARASVKGKVSTGVKVGDRSLGIVINETSR